MRGMPNLPEQLPDDVDALKALVTVQAARNEQLEQENQRMNAQVLSLQEQLNLALARRYAASSEKISPDQIRLFDEAEQAADTATPADEMVPDDMSIPAHTRKQRGRKPLPDTLPRVDVVHEMSKEGKRSINDTLDGCDERFEGKRCPQLQSL